MTTTRIPLLLVTLAALAMPGSSRAQSEPTGTALVTIKGTLVKDQAAANEVGWGGISFGFTGDNANTTRWFGVVHATVFGTDSFDAKTAIFKAHYDPTLIVAGPPELAKQLIGLPDGTRVQIEGAVLRGSRNMLLSFVKPLPAN
jgi:hypothetical protein